MKKLHILVFVILCVVFVAVLFACTPKDVDYSDDDTNTGNDDSGIVLSFDTVYAYAKDAGYKGTMEELVEMFKGDSAYEIAVANGYEGTEVEWLATLIGATGKDGTNGTDGKDGADGVDGIDGITPHIGENGNWHIGDIDTGIKAQGPQGSQGEQGIQGPQGEKGETGATGNGIAQILKKTSGLINVYTLVYTDGNTYDIVITNGANGNNGTNGITPSIGENGNWYFGDVDTGVLASGKNGVGISGITKTTDGLVDSYVIDYSNGDKYSFTINNGKDGVDGITPEIGENGNWWIGTTDTGVKAQGDKGETGNGIASINKESNGSVDTYTITYTDGTTYELIITNGLNGTTPHIGTNGNWWIGDSDTTVPAQGDKGETGNGINYITKTSNGLTDTYTIHFTNGESYSFDVTNAPSTLMVKVTFDAEGGVIDDGYTYLDLTLVNGTADIFECDFNAYNSIKELPIPVKNGKVFIGWYTGNTINDSQWYNYSTLSSDITLHARWRDIKVTTQTNIIGAGTYTLLDSTDYSIIIDGTLCSNTNTGYVWLGWFDGNRKVSCSNDTQYVIENAYCDKIYIAKWAYVYESIYLTDNYVVYDGKEHGLILGYLDEYVENDSIKIEYSENGVEYSEKEVTKIDAGVYDIYYRIKYDEDIKISNKLTLIIEPALVSIDPYNKIVDNVFDIEAQIDVESDNNTQTYILTTPIIWWINESKEVVAEGNYTLSFSNGTVFTPGTHITTMTFSSQNFKLNTEDGSQAIDFYIKYKSVLVGDTLYTPEDALYNAKNGNIIVKTNTSFADQSKVISRYYRNNLYYTVKKDVTFLLPFSATDIIGFLPGGETGTDEYEAHPVGTTEADPASTLYITLNVPANVIITVNGTLTVGAVTGRQSHGYRQNNVSGNYCVMNLAGNVVVNSATLNVYGYVLGSGKITTNGSTQVTENMYLSGWTTGSVVAARFIGNAEIMATTFLTGGTYTVDNPTMFPFNQYELRSIQTTLEINYGGSLRGVIKISTSEQTAVNIIIAKARIDLSYISIISSSTSEGSGIIRMTQAGDKVTKSTANGRVKFTLDGTIKDGYTSLGVKVLAKDISVTSQKVLFPIAGTCDIVVNSGSFTQNYQYKMMPGATLTVKKGATFNSNNTLVTFKDGFVDVVGPVSYPQGRGDAKVIVEGTFNINGAFGGSVYGVNGGKVVVGANATITSVKSIEGNGSMARDGLKVNFTFTESGSVVRNLDLFNASGTSFAAVGTTYTYNGNAWE